MQFMNSSLYKLVNNLSDEDFKYLVKKSRSENLELVKQKADYLYEYMNSLERFNEEILPARRFFIALQRMEKSVMMVKYQMVT